MDVVRRPLVMNTMIIVCICIHFVVTLAQDAGDFNPESLNLTTEEAMPGLKAGAALRLGAAFWGTLCIGVGYKYHWGFFGPFNFSGLAMTLLLTLLHLHILVVSNSRYGQHVVKLALLIDFMVSVVFTIGGVIYFLNDMSFQLKALLPLTFVVMTSGACVQLSQVLESLSRPS